MAIFRKIVIPFDGSDPSKRAASQALDLAKDQGAEVIGIKVISFTGELIAPTDALWASIEKDLHDKAQAVLDELISLASGKGVELKTEILEGETATEIINYAKENNVDLIVVGHSGKGGIGRKIMGSRTARMMNDATCPVLVVH